MPARSGRRNRDTVLLQKDLKALGTSARPTWVLDIQSKTLLWANAASVELCDAAGLDDLLSRDFAADNAVFTEARLHDYLQHFERGEAIAEQWTFYPNGQPVTVRCRCSGITTADGRVAMLVEGIPLEPSEVERDTLRGVEALRHTPVMISMFSMDGQALFENPAAQRAYVPADKGHNQFGDRFLHAPAGRTIWSQIIANGEYSGQEQVCTPVGVRWHDFHCRLAEDPATGAKVVLVNEQDITDAHTANERYRQLFVGNKAVMLLIDPADGRIVDANEAAADFYGYDLAQLRSLEISDINTLSAEQIKAEMERARQEQRSKFYFRHRRACGEVRDVEVHSGPMMLGDKQLLYSIVHDITVQRAAETSLTASERKHRYVIDNTPAGFWLLDAQCCTVQVNRALSNMIGYETHELMGRTPFEFVDGENAANFRHQMTRIATLRHCNFQIALRHKRGHKISTHFSATIMDDETGTHQGAFAFVTDLTELKQAEEARRRSDLVIQTAFDNAVNGIVMMNPDGRFFRVNRAFCRMLGYSEAELLGKHSNDVTHPEDIDYTLAGKRRLLDGEVRTLQLEKRYLHKDGSIVWALVNAAVITDEQGTPLHVIVQTEDITERRKTAETLEKLSRAVEHSGSSVIIADTRGVIEYVNPQFTRVTGYAPEDVIGHTPAILKSGQTHKATYDDLWRTIRAGKEWRGELLNRKKSGERYWTLLSISPMKNNAGEVTHFIALSEDITALKEAHAKAEYLSLYDSLTELANRRLFIDRLNQAVEASLRDRSQTALMYLDLDHFKNINDTLGHDAGDRLLQTVASRLLHCVRRQDTVARLGGDEFAILIPHVDGVQGVRSVAAKVIQTLNRPLDIPGFHNNVTTSIGITLAPDDSSSPEVLLKNADLALYSAKAKGRNNFQFFTEEMNREVSHRLMVEHDLLHALENGELELHYQPIVRLRDRRVVGVEALLRWNHAELGLLPPDTFIPVAEESGLIRSVGEWVLRTACRDLVGMRDRGLPVDWVSINISAHQFQHPDFLDRIVRSLKGARPTGMALKLELTESALMEDTQHAIGTLNRLKELGFGLSIDDFGTGYSSLAYLKRFPVDTLKIDRSFVTDIPTDANDMEITAAIIAMAHKLGIEAVAEGVETEEQLAFLNNNRCAMGQGYLFGYPLPQGQLDAVLKGRQP